MKPKIFNCESVKLPKFKSVYVAKFDSDLFGS